MENLVQLLQQQEMNEVEHESLPVEARNSEKWRDLNLALKEC